MSRHRLGLALSLAVALAVAGCTTALPGGGSQVTGTIKVGVEFPLSGDDAADGIGARHGVELAIAEAGSVCGATAHQDACFRLQIAGFDDSAAGIHDPAVGAKMVQAMAADPLVAGMVGPLYDSLVRSELPIANASHLAMVSPANTDECLTQEPPDGHCRGLAARLRPRGPNNYFRIVTTQLVEGTAAADLAFKTLGKRQAFVVNEQTPFGQGIATAFAARFAADGGMVVDAARPESFDPAHAPDLTALVQRARTLTADVIYFAGSEINTAAQLRRAMAARIPGVPLVGSDRLANDQFAKLAGSDARGSYYTLVGPYAPELNQAQGFRRAYRRAYGRDIGVFSLPAFDATNVLIRAIGRAIDDSRGKPPTRDQVLGELSRTTDYRAVMGVMSFDSRGDTTLKVISAYQWMAATEPTGRFVAQLTVR